jgi:hypothetical protein
VYGESGNHLAKAMSKRNNRRQPRGEMKISARKHK